MKYYRALALLMVAGRCAAVEVGGAPDLATITSAKPMALPSALPARRSAISAQLPLLVSPAVPVAQAHAAVSQQPAAAPRQPASVEEAKTVSGTLFESAAKPSGDSDVPVFAAGGANLLLPSGSAPGPRLVPRTLREKMSERYHFRRLWLQNMYWYAITHIQGMWPKYHAKIIVAQAKGATLPVSSHRRFFSYMRVMGQTGKFYVLGFAPRGDKEVLQEARDTFKKYFTSIEIGPEEDAAFEGFLGRLTKYNAARRNQTNLRKHIRDSMLTASITPADQVADYFNGLFRDDVRQQTNEFQENGGQQKTLEAFRRAVLDTIAEEDPLAKDRVVGVVLLGSFASGGATARSDLDVELLTASGHATRVKDFKKRLTDRWRAAGQHKDHPVSVKDFPDPPFRAVIDRIHYFDYIVISPSPEIVSALARKPGEQPPFIASEQMGPLGPLQRKLQYFLVYWTTVWSDLKALFA